MAKEDSAASGRSADVFRISFIYRLGRSLVADTRRVPFRVVKLRTLRLVQKLLVTLPYHVELPFEATIGRRLSLPHPYRIIVSGQSSIGDDARIFHGVTVGADDRDTSKAPRLGNGVFVGASALVIGDVHLGDHVVVGAGAVVTKNVPAYGTVIGVNVLKTREISPDA